MVEERAVQRVGNRTFVFVQRQVGLFEARDVKLGDSTDSRSKRLMVCRRENRSSGKERLCSNLNC